MKRSPAIGTVARVGAVLLAVGGVIGVVLGVSLAVTESRGSPTARAGSSVPLGQLHCDNSMVAVSVDYAIPATPVDTLSPEAQADRWAEALKLDKRYPQLERHTVSRSADHLRIAFIDDAGRAVAVLAYDKHPTYGWRLTSVNRCAS